MSRLRRAFPCVFQSCVACWVAAWKTSYWASVRVIVIVLCPSHIVWFVLCGGRGVCLVLLFLFR